MVFLIYGKNLPILTQEIQLYKNKGYKTFYGTQENLKTKILNTKNLFGEEKENKIIIPLDILDLKLDKELAIILKQPTNKNIVLYSEKENLKSWADKYKLKAKIKKIEPLKETEVFKFIDSVFGGNIESSLEKMEPLIVKYSANYLIAMLFSTLRNLLLFYYNPKEFDKLHPYVRQKTNQLSTKISKKGIYNVIMAIKEADYKIKSNIDDKTIITSIILYIKNNLK